LPSPAFSTRAARPSCPSAAVSGCWPSSAQWRARPPVGSGEKDGPFGRAGRPWRRKAAKRGLAYGTARRIRRWKSAPRLLPVSRAFAHFVGAGPGRLCAKARWRCPRPDGSCRRASIRPGEGRAGRDKRAAASWPRPRPPPGRRRVRRGRARATLLVEEPGTNHPAWDTAPAFAQSRTRPRRSGRRRAHREQPRGRLPPDEFLRAGPVGQAPLSQLLLQGRPARPKGHLFRRTHGRPRRHCADDGQQPLTAADGQLGLAALVEKAGDGKLLHPIVTGGRALASVPYFAAFARRFSSSEAGCARSAGCPRAGSAAPRRTSRTACFHVGEDLRMQLEGSRARSRGPGPMRSAAVAEPGAALLD